MVPSRLKICADVIDGCYSDYSLLDIGCRTMALKPLLKNCIGYYGTDIYPAKDVFVYPSYLKNRFTLPR